MTVAANMHTNLGSSSSSASESQAGPIDQIPNHPQVDSMDYSTSLHILPSQEGGVENHHSSLLSVLITLATEGRLPQELRTLFIDSYAMSPNPAPV
eukprot:7684294-Ditylum_brightwellii.AAC.1